VEAAIKRALQIYGGARGCAADVAAAYGDYPELAARRMRWARSLIEDLYERRMPYFPRRATRLTASSRHPAGRRNANPHQQPAERRTANRTPIRQANASR
jgi:hypothetical protein